MQPPILAGIVLWTCASLATSPQHLYRTLRDTAEPDSYSSNNTASEEADYFHYLTRPDIRASKWNITVYDEAALAPGYWFVAPYAWLEQKERGDPWIGPYIYDQDGELVWSGAPMFDHFNTFDFRPITIHGESMFTLVYKRMDAGLIMDSEYRIRKMVHWPGGYDAANMHEFSLFDEGSKAMVLSRESRNVTIEEGELNEYEGPCYVHPNGLLELDISGDSQQLLFNWSWIDHASLEENTATQNYTLLETFCQIGWDINHCNSIDRFSNGDYLLSCRHTDAMYRISRLTGTIVWRLGGPKSSFRFLNEAKFSRQHHARIVSHNDTHTLLTLFDNARFESPSTTATHDYSRGLILSLHDGVAQIVQEFPRPDRNFTGSRGSMQILPNGNVFMCWSKDAWISEHLADGSILMEARLPLGKNSYRAYKAPWIGEPVEPPDVFAWAVESERGLETRVFVSWNGATEVVGWRVYESEIGSEKTRFLQDFEKVGFESDVTLDGLVEYVIVAGIDRYGEPLGQSKVVKTMHANRDDPSRYIEEQAWLAKYAPAMLHHESQENQEKKPYRTHPGARPPYLHQQAKANDTVVTLGTKSMILAYVGGFVTCLGVGMLYWIGCCLTKMYRKTSQVQEYAPVGKEDVDENHELLEGPTNNISRKNASLSDTSGSRPPDYVD